jgi:CheY-like chemotaxis protein
VLIADDDPHMRRLLLAALRQFKFLPIDEVNDREDLERGACPPRINLVVTDLVLPGVSGTEMVRRWRLNQPRLKAVCLRANAKALFDPPHTPFLLNGVCDAVASLHHADVTARRDLRLWYSMVFAEVSDELRARAWDMFAPLTQRREVQMNSMNVVIQIFAELPRDDPFEHEMRRRGDHASVDDLRSPARTWQFARFENCGGAPLRT